MSNRKLSVHQEHELLQKLEDAGLTDELAQAVIESTSNGLAKKTVVFISRGGYEATTSQKLAREIMGRNMVGIEEGVQCFGLTPTDEQLKTLSDVPFSEDVLRAHKDTHVLVANLGLSIVDIRSKVAGKGKIFYGQDWYDNQKFAKKAGQVGWLLIRKDQVPNSTSKTWNEQQALLGKDEYTPTAQEMIYAMVGYFLATGERLFEHIYVRCSDLTSVGIRVYLGCFDASGLFVYDDWDGGRYGYVALSVARKF